MNTMNTIIESSVSNLIGALCTTDERGNTFWLPPEAALRIGQYGTSGMQMPDAVKEVIASPSNIEATVGDRPARALIYQAVRAMVMAAGYRADGVLARVQIGQIGGSPNITQEVERLRARAIGREPDLETFLLGGVSNEVRQEYKRLVENEAGRDERLGMLMEHHRYTCDAVKASWGLIYAKQLSDYADANNQRTPMIDPLVWDRAVAKIQILDQVTHGLLPLAKGGAK